MRLIQVQVAAFLQERYEAELKHYNVYDTYTPDLKRTLLTSKFYSKYEVPGQDEADPILMDKIHKAKYDIPSERYPWPLTENQRYGWFHEPIVPIDRNDKRFYFPRRSSDFIKHQLKLKDEESLLPKVKFAGVPFKVQ